MMSQSVWKNVAPPIAGTGRYEVFAPTMAGHNGGPKGPFFLGSGALADDVERRMDALGWVPRTLLAIRWAAGWRSSWSAAGGPAP